MDGISDSTERPSALEAIERAEEVGRLRGLAQMDVDALAAYDAVLHRLAAGPLPDKLAEFRADHARHVEELNAAILARGGRPVPLRPDLRGAGMRAVTATASLMGTYPALLAMLGNEDYTNRAYDFALRHRWSDDVRLLIVRNREDERRHVAWIREASRIKVFDAPDLEVPA